MLMSDGTDFTDWVWAPNGGGEGGRWGLAMGVWGDRPCQSEGLTDRCDVGRGDGGHPRPSWANMGSFYWFIKVADPVTPHPPPTHPQETLLNGEILSVWKRRGQRMGGSGSGRPRETTGELDGCNKDLASVFFFFFLLY